MPNLRDPHLNKVRQAPRLVVIGMSKRKVSKQLKVNGHNLNRLLREYAERRTAGTLFEDLDRVSEADLYNHTFQMKFISDRQNKEGLKIGPSSTDSVDG